MNDVTDRVEALEAKIAGVYELLQKVADALQYQRERIDHEQARLRAHVVLTSAMLNSLQTVAPDAASTIIALLEQSERDFVRTDAHEATVLEIREILAVLRAQRIR